MTPAKTLKFYDPPYPFLLKQIHDPPRVLYYKGDLEALKKPCVSVVGTRKNSEYGEFITQKIIEELRILDITIVSGLANGIDSIAHKSALANDLPTIAILGSGIDNIYPRENQNLADEIAKTGLILSEFKGTTEPINFHFPMRNRIISGLSVATIVIEAGEKSGAIITAGLALEQGREIFVVPGDVDREQSKGPLRLLQKGAAYPVSCGAEIIEILKKQPTLFQQKNLTPKEKTILKTPLYILSEDENKVLYSLTPHRFASIDKIKEKTNLPIEKILSILSILEIRDLIITKDGKYSRKD